MHTTLRQALGEYPTGVTIVTTRTPEGRNVGLTVNSFASLSLEPPLLLWSLANKSPNMRAFRTATHFAVNVLADSQQELATRFATPTITDKFAGVALGETCNLPQLNGAPQANPAPLLAGTTAHFLCATRDVLEAGDHALFIGRVEHFWRDTATKPLVFCGGRFTAIQTP